MRSVTKGSHWLKLFIASFPWTTLTLGQMLMAYITLTVDLSQFWDIFILWHYAGVVYAMAVCLSQAIVLSKWRNLAACKQTLHVGLVGSICVSDSYQQLFWSTSSVFDVWSSGLLGGLSDGQELITRHFVLSNTFYGQCLGWFENLSQFISVLYSALAALQLCAI